MNGTIIGVKAPQKLRVKFFDKELYPEGLQKIGGKKSDWIDLRAREDLKLEKGEFKLVNLGVAIELPEGFEAIISMLDYSLDTKRKRHIRRKMPKKAN